MVKRYVHPSSPVGGHLINEMRETYFKEGLGNYLIITKYSKYSIKDLYHIQNVYNLPSHMKQWVN